MDNILAFLSKYATIFISSRSILIDSVMYSFLFLQVVLELVWKNLWIICFRTPGSCVAICTEFRIWTEREIQSEKQKQRANSIQEILYLCCQVLCVVVCLNKTCFKTGGTLALRAKKKKKLQSSIYLLSLKGNSRQLRGVLLYFTLNDVQGILGSYLQAYFSHWHSIKITVNAAPTLLNGLYNVSSEQSWQVHANFLLKSSGSMLSNWAFFTFLFTDEFMNTPDHKVINNKTPVGISFLNKEVSVYQHMKQASEICRLQAA